jgi:hypothetical protein
MSAKRELSMGQLGHSLRLHCDGVGLRVDVSIIRDYRRPSLSAKQSTPTPTIAASVRRIPGLLGDKLCGARAMRTEMPAFLPLATFVFAGLAATSAAEAAGGARILPARKR